MALIAGSDDDERVLFVLSGSSGSGKTTVVRLLDGQVADLALHELSELADEPFSWTVEARRELTERWIVRALEEEERGRDLLLTEAILGEVLASPSATRLAGIAACLVDCADEERVRRIRERAPDQDYSKHQLWDFVAWGVWLRFHCVDPKFFAGPIRGDGGADWHWRRWEEWPNGDPRWSVFRLDTTDELPDQSAARLAEWIDDRRAALREGRLPLAGRWWH